MEGATRGIMLLPLLVAGLLAFEGAALGAPQTASTSASVESNSGTSKANNPRPADAKESTATLSEGLLRVRRVYVENLGDERVAKEMQDMIINGLNESKRFIVTENKDRADAVLKGSSLEKRSQEFHSSREGTAVGGATAHGAGAAGISDSSASTETIYEAHAAVRLVNTDGDVIWSTTQESRGAKYKSASADVADKIVKQLLRDIEKLEKRNSSSATERKQ